MAPVHEYCLEGMSICAKIQSNELSQLRAWDWREPKCLV